MIDNNEINLPSEILESRPEIKETQIGILKGVFGAVPFVGTMINEILFDIPGRIYQSRINEMVEILKQKVSELDSKSIKQEYLESEDFFDYTRQMIECSIKLKTAEKRNCLSNIYVNSFTECSEFDSHKNRMFMKFVVDLTSIQIEILKFIQIQEDKLEEIGTYSKFFALFNEFHGELKLDSYEFKYYCNNLELMSLVSFGAGLDDFNSTSQVLVDSDHKEPTAVITSLGIEFISYLKN
jgi:hypothetical protein